MTNYEKALNDFDIDELDMMEEFHYNHFIKQNDKVSTLKLIINTIEGDYSQLSDGLREIAEEFDPYSELGELITVTI